MSHLESLAMTCAHEGGYSNQSAEVCAVAVRCGLKEFDNVDAASYRLSRDKRMRQEAKELRKRIAPQVRQEAKAMGFGVLSLFMWFILPKLIWWVCEWLVRKWYSESRGQLQAAQRELL